MGRFDLVIFDCDGVLVDSERLAVRTEVAILSASDGLSEAEVIERFVGRSDTYMHKAIEQHLGRSVDWEAVFEPRYREVFERGSSPCRVSSRRSPGSPPRCAWRRAEVTTRCGSPWARPD